MVSSILQRWFGKSSALSATLPKEYIYYAKNSYPSNHTYRISRGKLSPKRQLAMRYEIINSLFPKQLTSFLDTAFSKGYFVFSASQRLECIRSMGIDINHYDINFCNAVKNYLGDNRSQFQLLQLHELADQIDQFGGPFQTVLISNVYQYLYFGSEILTSAYLDHDLIFKNIRKVCSERVIFANRVNLKDVQINKCMAAAGDKRLAYTEEKIIEAASGYFNVTKQGYIGKYPIWTLDVKSSS